MTKEDIEVWAKSVGFKREAGTNHWIREGGLKRQADGVPHNSGYRLRLRISPRRVYLDDFTGGTLWNRAWCCRDRAWLSKVTINVKNWLDGWEG